MYNTQFQTKLSGYLGEEVFFFQNGCHKAGFMYIWFQLDLTSSWEYALKSILDMATEASIHVQDIVAPSFEQWPMPHT